MTTVQENTLNDTDTDTGVDTDTGDAAPARARAWWRSATIYQVYTRSFADSNGDGIGDLPGVRAKLPYLAALGVDALWFNPWYPSPMADAGYDIADYRDIEPAFGTLADADALIAQAHARGIRIIVDIVPNHCSDRHRWFLQAVDSEPGSRERSRFWFRPGRGEDGSQPPNDWRSIFGGPAWTRLTASDGTPGEWYLHLFAPEQPDLNWSSPDVRAEFEDVLRFWFDRGADGIRIDSAALVTKDPDLPDLSSNPDPHPYEDRDDVHEIYRAWRAVAESYGGDRALIGELWIPDAERFARYFRPDELHSAFNFPYLCSAWDAAQLRSVIEQTLAVHARVDAPATWVLSNHDVDRHVSRYGRSDTSFGLDRREHGRPVDVGLGTRRARAAAMLTFALPGAAYVYQGDELGLWEVENIPADLRQDPIWRRTGGSDPGRDGCRVPLPWSGAAPPFGFSPDGAPADPWLPQPPAWSGLTVEAEDGDLRSMLELYRAALRIRRQDPALGDGTLTWMPSGESVLDFLRDGRFRCVANLSPTDIALPPHEDVLLQSTDLAEGLLPPDATVWLRVAD
ncbi:glycoside hydrolase family 13 protein [Catenulispora pinisilvae]|uniref:glycoside hydrolase family 13 protein n=1 Tax=Catenulispora pinisilvae TaxID=2705253 RepID=UPI0018925B4A|nr:glycoside hydrolase family 13 protein [Catenulispora pinisilvae]